MREHNILKIAHPKNIASLVSLGTPYNGSWYDNWFVELLGINDFQDQPCLTGACGHSYYFCNLSTRKNTWNSTYAQNTHINFRALSGTTSVSLLNHIIWDNNYLEDYVGSAGWIRASYVTALAISPMITIGGLACLPGDICVDKLSQEASGFSGVNNFSKNFTSSNSNVNKRSQDSFPVPHNLEAYDSDMHEYIFNNMTFGAPFSVNQAGDTITGYNVSLNGSLNLPQTINGKTITSIGSGSFQNSQLSQISIPASVTSIGNNAFAGCSNLSIIVNRASVPLGWNDWNPDNRPVVCTVGGGCGNAHSIAYSKINASVHTKYCLVCSDSVQTGHNLKYTMAFPNALTHTAECRGCNYVGKFEPHITAGNGNIICCQVNAVRAIIYGNENEQDFEHVH